MADVSGANGPKRPNWLLKSSQTTRQATALKAAPRDSLQISGPAQQSQSSPFILGGIGDAVKAVGNAGGQAVSGVGNVAGNVASTLAKGLKASLHAIFDPSSNGDAVRSAVANEDVNALIAALQAKRPDGGSAWNDMDEETRKLIASNDPKIRAGLAAMVTNSHTQDLVARIKADPKFAKHVSDRIDQMTDKQAADAADDIRKMKHSDDPGKLGAVDAVRLDGAYSSSTVSYTM